MFGLIILISPVGHPVGWIDRDLYLAFDKIHFSKTAGLSVSNNVDEMSFVCMASKSNMLATLISSRAEGTTLEQELTSHQYGNGQSVMSDWRASQ